MSTKVTVKSTGELTRADVEALIEQWLEHERIANGASANTVAAYHKGLQVFRDWLEENNDGTVTPQIVLQFKGDLAERYAAQTVNLRLAAVRSFYRFLVTTGRMAYNLASDIKNAKRTKSRVHQRDALSNGEVVAVLQTCDLGTLGGVRDLAILSLMAYCGLRTVEVHRANIGNLKTEGDRLVLEVHGKGRTDADEIVVIPSAVEGAIRSWLSHRLTFKAHGDDDPLFVSLSNQNRGKRLGLVGIRMMVKARYRDAGVVGNKSTHSLRHSAITNAIRHGASPMQVQAMARHTSFDTTLGYVHEVDRVDNPAEDLISYEVQGWLDVQEHAAEP